MVFTQLTLDPSLGLGEFVGLGAHCTPDSDFSTATKTYKSWINLCGTTSPEQCDHTVIEANGIRFVRVPVEVSILFMVWLDPSVLTVLHN